MINKFIMSISVCVFVYYVRRKYGMNNYMIKIKEKKEKLITNRISIIHHYKEPFKQQQR